MSPPFRALAHLNLSEVLYPPQLHSASASSTTQRKRMSSLFPAISDQARSNNPKRRRKLEGGGAAPKRSEDQALLALIKKATSIRRRSKSVGADGKRESAEMDEDEDNDKAYWTELKKMLRGGDEMLARQAFGFVVAQLRDRHSEVRKACIPTACMTRVPGIFFPTSRNSTRNIRLHDHLQVRKRALLLLGRLVKRSATLRTELARNIRVSAEVTGLTKRGCVFDLPHFQSQVASPLSFPPFLSPS